MAHALPTYPAFDCNGDSVGVRWKKWITRLESNLFVGYAIEDPVRRRALMLSYGGEELNDIYDSLDPEKLVV